MSIKGIPIRPAGGTCISDLSKKSRGVFKVGPYQPVVSWILSPHFTPVAELYGHRGLTPFISIYNNRRGPFGTFFPS